MATSLQKRSLPVYRDIVHWERAKERPVILTLSRVSQDLPGAKGEARALP